MTLLFRYAYPPQEQPLVPRPHCFLTHELTVLLLIFFVDSLAILNTHRVHGTSAAWCFCGSIVQWYTGTRVSLPCPSPLKLLCCRCFLNFRRVRDLHVPCYWCEMLQGMGYPPRFTSLAFFSHYPGDNQSHEVYLQLSDETIILRLQSLLDLFTSCVRPP